MARRERPKKKGLNPIVAILILLGSVGFAAKSLLGSFGGGSASEFAELIGFDDEDDELDMGEGETNAQIVWRDLLTEHGSYDRQTPVRLAFSVMAKTTPGAAPAGETAERWAGAEPPLLRLGVVMVSEKSRRAVLGGSVVGIGDYASGGSVSAIEPGLLRLRWQQRELTYDLESEVPREFRVEHARRLREQLVAAESEPGGGAPAGDASTSSPATGSNESKGKVK